jgi:hypothetical protein
LSLAKAFVNRSKSAFARTEPRSGLRTNLT